MWWPIELLVRIFYWVPADERGPEIEYTIREVHGQVGVPSTPPHSFRP